MISLHSSHMQEILNTLSDLSDKQVAAALDTMYAEIDAGIINVSDVFLRNLIEFSRSRTEMVLRRGQNQHAPVEGIST